jgi:hypothetical protein
MLSNAIHFRKNGPVRITFTFIQIMVANTSCLPCSELELRSIVRHENQPQISQIRGWGWGYMALFSGRISEQHVNKILV